MRDDDDNTPESVISDVQVVNLRKAGVSYQEIADTLGVTVRTAHDAFRRGVAAMPAEAGEEMRVLSQGRQEFVTRAMIAVMTAHHPLVNNGRVMTDPRTGELLDDPMPKIAAAKILMTVDERFARLFGLDAPRTTVTIALDQIDAEIRKLEAELGENLPKGDGGVETPGRKPKPPMELPPGFR